MAIALIVFDLIGTTVSDHKNKLGEGFRATLQKYGYELPIGEINPLMGYDMREVITEILKTHEPNALKVDKPYISRVNRDFAARMIRYYETTDDAVPLPGVEETFGLLREHGVRIAVNTALPRYIADVVLGKLGWIERGLIDHVIATDEVVRGRPFPDMIQRLMAKADVSDPSLVAKVGDTGAGISEGRQADCRFVIGITTGICPREVLQTHRPTHVIDHIQEVVGILGN